jgi:hypothetical protein
MIIPGLENALHDGEAHRAIVRRIEPVGRDAVVDFAAVDHPGLSFVAVVPAEHGPEGGLAVGDECLVRFRAGTGIGRPARWELVGRLAQAPCPAPVPAGSEVSG